MTKPREMVQSEEKTPRIFFCCDNLPGGKYVFGSQDAIGIVYPGLAKADYNGDYWPEQIEHIQQEETLRFVEGLPYLILLGPRHSEFDVLYLTYYKRHRYHANQSQGAGLGHQSLLASRLSERQH